MAFRRESDEEHKEPKFERPLPSGPNRVTKAGLAQIATRLTELDAALEQAADEDAREAIRRDLRYWKTRRATAEPTIAPEDGTAGFGTRVTYRMGGTVREITIVGDDEADPAAGRIAWSAPLARTLSGLEPGEVADFNGRAGTLELVAVEPID